MSSRCLDLSSAPLRAQLIFSSTVNSCKLITASAGHVFSGWNHLDDGYIK